MIKVMVVGHGHFPKSLLESVEMVNGKLEHVEFLNLNQHDGIVGFKDAFQQKLEIINELSMIQKIDGILILCDLQGGTPYNVAYHSMINNQAIPISVIAGVNFGMLLMVEEIVGLSNLEQATSDLIERGRESIISASRREDTIVEDDF